MRQVHVTNQAISERKPQPVVTENLHVSDVVGRWWHTPRYLGDAIPLPAPAFAWNPMPLVPSITVYVVFGKR
jgi:hypothetical protein